MNSSRFVAVIAVLSSGPLVPSQSPQALMADLLVPLHTGEADPIGGDYGLWAAGPDWKASFHDGFRFFPYRGPDRPLVSVRWDTESIKVGDRELVVGRGKAYTEDWRHELDYGAVTEVYEIRREGVEQMFVLERPVGAGDVVVTGRVRTPLHADLRDDVCQAVDFCEAGEPTVRYGEAVAFDAAGRRAEVTTSFDGERVRLRLDASFLAGAEYPVTIDPLTQATSISFNASGGKALRTKVAADNSSDGQYAAVAIVRTFALGDHDAHALRCDKTFGDSKTIFSDSSDSWSTVQIDVAHIDGADRFAFAIQRNFPGSLSPRGVSVYLHDEDSTTINSGPLLAAPTLLSHWNQKPQISGARNGGPNGLLVVEAEQFVGGDGTSVRSILVDGVNRTLGSSHDLDRHVYGVNYDPAVVQCTNNQDDWVAVWKTEPYEWFQPIEIRWARIGRDGIAHRNGSVWKGPTPQHTHLDDGPIAVDGSIEPGSGGRYALAFVRPVDPDRWALSVVRWDTGAAGIETQRLTDVLVTRSLKIVDEYDLSHDWSTRSHWALAYSTGAFAFLTAHVARLGSSGRVTESRSIFPSPTHWPAALGVGFAAGPQGTSFMVTYAEEASAFPVRGMRLVYPPDATATTYGAGCGPGQIRASTPPFAGSEDFAIEVEPVVAQDFVHHVFGFAQGQLDLTPYGLAGCSLLVDLNGAVHLGEVFQGLGAVHSRGLPLPGWFQGDLFVQAIVLPSTGMPFATPGLRVQVR